MAVDIRPRELTAALGGAAVGWPLGARARQAPWNLAQTLRSPILRYGLAVVCVAIPLGLALALQYYEFRDVGLPIFSVGIAITTWYAGVGPSVLAILLCKIGRAS